MFHNDPLERGPLLRPLSIHDTMPYDRMAHRKTAAFRRRVLRAQKDPCCEDDSEAHRGRANEFCTSLGDGTSVDGTSKFA